MAHQKNRRYCTLFLFCFTVFFIPAPHSVTGCAIKSLQNGAHGASSSITIRIPDQTIPFIYGAIMSLCISPFPGPSSTPPSTPFLK